MESNGGRVRGIISRDLGPARSCGAPDDSIGPAIQPWAVMWAVLRVLMGVLFVFFL